MAANRSRLKSLKSTQYTSSARRESGAERLRALGYRGGLRALDLADRLLGRERDLVPPRRHRRFIGNGDFLKVGRAITDYMVDELGLQPSHDVLDVGSGVGRIAVPLTSVLTEGSYLGFDIVDHAIDWCRSNITPRYPNFRFEHADIQQDIYNPQGRFTAADFRFPAEDAGFDIAALVGVVCLLLPDELENYVAESARVLRPGGKCFATVYLMDDTVAERARQGRTAFAFTHDRGDHFVISEQEPTYAIAYRLDHIESVCERHGLRLDRAPQLGSWSTSPERPASMDIVVFERS